VTLTAFRHRIADLIDYQLAGVDPASGLLTFQTANVGRVGTAGVDTELSVRPTTWATMALGYSRLSATDRETGEPLTGRASNTLKGRVRLTSTRLGLSVAVFGRFVGRRAFADTDADGGIDDFSPGLQLWDARVSQRLGRTLELFIGADNLLDEQDARSYPSAGRRMYSGIAVNVGG
jgi:outer membrane receptor protein involved in Fe transport